MKNTLVANGRRLGYRLRGRSRKTPLVLVHGFCEDSTVWDPLMPHLQGMRVLRIDLPGFGGSDLPLAAGMDAYADAVCAVLNELNIPQAVLIGHSMGGYTVLEFAGKYPERLAGLGLFHSHPYADTPEKKENRRRGIAQLQAGKKDLYVAELFPGLFSPAYSRTHPDVIEGLVRRARQDPADGIAAGLEAMIDRRDTSDLLKRLVCPVLFVLGEEDAIVSPDTVLPATHLPELAALHLLPGVAHMGMFEAAEACAAILSDFWSFCLERRPAAGRTGQNPRPA